MAGRKSADAGTPTSGNAGDNSEYVDPAAAVGGNSGGSGGSDDGTIVRDATGAIFDPSIHIGPDKRNKDGSFRRKRQRGGSDSGSGRKAKISEDLGELVSILSAGMVMLHAALAEGTGTPELALAPQEAESLASSGLTFLAQFGVKPNPKVTAGIIFASNVAAIYGTRYAAIRIRKAQEARERQPGTAGVYGPNGEAQGTTAFTEQPPIDLTNLNNPKYMS